MRQFIFCLSIGLSACTSAVQSGELCSTVPATTTPVALHPPLRGEPYRNFGLTVHPILHTSRLHTGIDYKFDASEHAQAAAAGKVIEAGVKGPYGKYVLIDHGAGVSTAYAHLASIDVKQGQCVSAGEPIGIPGSTGLSTGPHLHFEVLKDGKAVDPLPLLAEVRAR